MAKNEVIQQLGRPENWATLLPNKQMNVHSVYDIESAKRPMLLGEIWIFEYARKDGKKFCVYLRDGSVSEIVEGALFRDEEKKSRTP